MTNPAYRHSNIRHRPPLRWPNGARVALWVVPNIEHYEYIPEEVGERDPWPRSPHPDILGYSQRDYGNRVGVWRLFEVIDELKIKCSASLNLGVFERFPEIMEACERRNWDIICHGVYNSRPVWGYSREREKKLIDDCMAMCRRLTGRSFRGWFAPMVSYTPNTIDLLIDAGIEYFCDWVFDDQPFPVRGKNGEIVSMPYQLDANDGMFFNRMFPHASGDDFARLLRDYFDRLYKEGAEQGRVACIALHPYIVGNPQYIESVKGALSYMMQHEGVWNATGAEILDWWRMNYLPQLKAHFDAVDAKVGRGPSRARG